MDIMEQSELNTTRTAPLIASSSRNERLLFVKEQWRCLFHCPSCGKCYVLRGRNPYELYADFIEGRREYMDITAEIRQNNVEK